MSFRFSGEKLRIIIRFDLDNDAGHDAERRARLKSRVKGLHEILRQSTNSKQNSTVKEALLPLVNIEIISE